MPPRRKQAKTVCQKTVTNIDENTNEKSEENQTTLENEINETESIRVGKIVTPPSRIIGLRSRHTPNKTPTSSKKKKRKPNIIPFMFSARQERELAEWYRDNPIFYDKRNKEYKLTQVKRRKIEDKANELKDAEGNECSVEQLLTWMTNMRTYFGKLSKQAKSGSGAEPTLTDRELWIRDTFTFLSDRIVRIKGRQISKLSDQTTEDAEDILPLYLESDSDEDPRLKDTVNRATIHRRPVKSPEQSDIETIEKVCSNILKNTAPPTQPSSPRTLELENFATDIVCSMKRIPEENWVDLKTEIMITIRNFARSSQQSCMGTYTDPPPNMNNQWNTARFGRNPSRTSTAFNNQQQWQQPLAVNIPGQGQYSHIGPSSSTKSDELSDSPFLSM